MLDLDFEASSEAYGKRTWNCVALDSMLMMQAHLIWSLLLAET